MTSNYYVILEIEPGVDQEIIEAAYRRLALLYHPDLNRSPEATYHMQEVNAAYNTLRNPGKRAIYDRDLGIVQASYANRPITVTAPIKTAYHPHIIYNPPQPPSKTPAPTSATSFETLLLTFYIENSIYAFNILEVESVNMMQPILQHLRAPAFVEGLITYRGLKLPVIDLRRHIGFPNKPTTRDTRILVVRFNQIATGLIVDSTGTPLRVENTSIETPQTLSEVYQSPFVKGIVHNGFQVVVILDLPTLLTAEEYQALTSFAGK